MIDRQKRAKEYRRTQDDCPRCGAKSLYPCRNYLGHKKPWCRVDAAAKPYKRRLVQGELFGEE